MESQMVQSLIKYVRMSSIKLVHIARLVQGKPVSYALDLLERIPRKSSRLVLEGLKSAVANAENNKGLSAKNLVVYRALIEKGPVFKRFRAAARGSAHTYRKHTSHIRIVLKAVEE